MADPYLYYMIQQVVIGLAFLAAIGFLVRLIVRSFQAKNACTSGCGKCGAIDVEKMARQIEASMAKQRVDPQL